MRNRSCLRFPPGSGRNCKNNLSDPPRQNILPGFHVLVALTTSLIGWVPTSLLLLLEFPMFADSTKIFCIDNTDSLPWTVGLLWKSYPPQTLWFPNNWIPHYPHLLAKYLMVQSCKSQSSMIHSCLIHLLMFYFNKSQHSNCWQIISARSIWGFPEMGVPPKHLF